MYHRANDIKLARANMEWLHVDLDYVDKLELYDWNKYVAQVRRGSYLRQALVEHIEPDRPLTQLSLAYGKGPKLSRIIHKRMHNHPSIVGIREHEVSA